MDTTKPMKITQFGKGGIVVDRTLRDYRLDVVPTAILLPKQYSVKDKVGIIKNQNGSGSCVSQATAYYAEVLNFLETGQKIQLSPRYIYSAVFQKPMGSSVPDNFSYVMNEGIATEQDIPSYTQNLTPPSEDFMQNGLDITFEIRERAKTYLAKSYVTWDNVNLDLYKQAIYQGTGCVVVAWGNNYLWQNGTIMLSDNKEQMTWRHGIYIVGWDDNTKMFEFVNSWGQWGFKGFGYLPYDYVTKGYVSNPMTLIDVPNTTYVSLMSIIKNLMEKIALLLKGRK